MPQRTTGTVTSSSSGPHSVSWQDGHQQRRSLPRRSVLLDTLDQTNRTLVRCAFRAGEPATERQRKEILLGPFSLLFVLGLLFYVYNGVRDDRWFGSFHLGLILCVSTAGVMICGVGATKRLPLRPAQTAILICSIGVLLIDLGNASLAGTPRVWALNILSVDGLILIRAETPPIAFVVAITLLMLGLTSTEEAYRWGLYRAEGWTTPLGKDLADRSCSDPPCEIGFLTAAAGYLIYTIIFFLDFHLTRSFATSMHNERARAQASVGLAHEITEALSEFDLAGADVRISNYSNQLPPGMGDCFSKLLKHLKGFGAFLPEEALTLTEVASSGSHGTPATPLNPLHPHDDTVPGRRSVDTQVISLEGSTIGDSLCFEGPPSGEVAIMFTDVEGSAELWDLFPVGMQRALVAHNTVMRVCGKRARGYECKTIGDAFMFAFQTAHAAVSAALQMQEGLCVALWPQELLKLPRCSRVVTSDGVCIWNGLRVRIGVHYGPAHREESPVTGRSDYFGRTVNVAARVESTAMGGMVCVSEAVMSELRSAASELLDVSEIITESLGEVPMKGIENPPSVTAVYSRRLEPRREELRSAQASRVLGLRESFAREGTVPAAQRPCSPISRHSRTSLFSRVTRMTSSAASVAWITAVPRLVEMPSEAVVVSLAAEVDAAADDTWGSVIALAGNSALVTWGACGRPCPQHAIQAVRGAAKATTGARVCTEANFSGVGTGPVLHGTIDAFKHRFVMTQGPGAELAVRLCHAAQRLHVRLLAAGCEGETSAAQEPAMVHAVRAIDAWPVQGSGDVITVYQFELDAVTSGRYSPGLRNARSVWNMLADAAVQGEGQQDAGEGRPGCWGSEEWRTLLLAVRSRTAGRKSPRSPRAKRDESDDMARLQQLAGIPSPQSPYAGMAESLRTISEASAGSSADVLQKVLENIDKGIHLTECPIVWDAHVTLTSGSRKAFSRFSVSPPSRYAASAEPTGVPDADS